MIDMEINLLELIMALSTFFFGFVVGLVISHNDKWYGSTSADDISMVCCCCVDILFRSTNKRTKTQMKKFSTDAEFIFSICYIYSKL